MSTRQVEGLFIPKDSKEFDSTIKSKKRACVQYTARTTSGSYNYKFVDFANRMKGKIDCVRVLTDETDIEVPEEQLPMFEVYENGELKDTFVKPNFDEVEDCCTKMAEKAE